MSIPAFSVRNPVLINMLMILILLGGIIFAFSLQKEMFPESRPDKLIISAVYPGVQPEDVEKAVTIKIEEAVRSLEGIDEVESQVSEGISFTTLTLLQSVDDVDVLLQEVRNEIDSLQDIPDDVEQIRLRKVEPQLPVISLAINGDLTEAELKESARKIRDELLTLPGVSRVQLDGIRNDEIYVDVIPDRLLEFNVTFEEVAAAIRGSNLDISGGSLKGDRSTVAVRTVGEVQEASRLTDIVVRADADGRRILLSDVAELSDGFVDSDLKMQFNGNRSVNCVVFKGEAEDAVKISQIVKTWTRARQGQEYTGSGPLMSGIWTIFGQPNLYNIHQQAAAMPLPDGVTVRLHTDIARFVEGRLDLMTRNGFAGLILVLISLNLFLNWRVAFWAAIGLVISFLGTFIVMWLLGASINLLSMFGLIIVLGIIVDDAIVIGENIYRHVEEGMPPMKAAIHGAEEVMWPVIVAVLTTIGAFAPLFFIKGQIGDFMSELPIVVIAALSISLVEALIILPAHLRHLPRPKAGKEAESTAATSASPAGDAMQLSFLNRLLMTPYLAMLRFCLKWRYLSVVAVVASAILCVGLVAGGVVPAAFIQDMDSESLICALEMPIGTSTERLDEEIEKLTDYIVRSGEFPEVINFQTIAGRQYDLTGAGSVGVEDQSHLGQVVVELCSAEDRDRSSEELVSLMREFSNTQLTGLNSVRWQAMSGGPGGTDIVVTVSGLSNEQLPTAISEMKGIIGQINGVYDLDDNLDLGKQELKLSLRDAASTVGLNEAAVGMYVRGALYGQEARRISRDREDVRIMVRYPEEFREDIWNVESMWVPTSAPAANRTWVPLQELVDVESGLGYSTITRYQQTRSATIFGSVDSAIVPSTRDVIQEYTRRFEAEVVPRYPGIKIQYLGQAEEMRKSFSSLWIAMLVALLVIYGMLAALFKSYTQPLVVMAAIVFGFLGAVIGHWITGETMTILSGIGLVALSGILVNDSLVLIAFVNQRVADGLPPYEACIDGAAKRLRAILLTTLTTAAGLIPLMFETSFQAKFLIPMAVTLTFGLLFATVLTLVLVPCLYLIRHDFVCRWLKMPTLPESMAGPSA